jgi:hypothetical protein
VADDRRSERVSELCEGEIEMTPREFYIARGIIVPGLAPAQGITSLGWIDRPTVRLDELGRTKAARTIAAPHLGGTVNFDQNPRVT